MIRRRSLPAVASLLFAAATLGPIPLPAAAWHATTAAGIEWHDNATNSAQEQKPDTSFDFDLDYGTHRLLGRDLQGSFALVANGSHWLDYEGLDLGEIAARAGLRWKFGLGPYAPRLDTAVTAGRLLARVGEWSGNHLRLNATLSRRFSPAWLASLSTEYNRLDARRAVYAHTQWNLLAGVDYDPTPDWRISLQARHRRGDQLSWCRNSWRPFIGTTQWRDGIFGGDWFPYRTDARLWGGRLTLSRALGANSNLALSGEFTESHSESHKTYRNHVLGLQFVHAF